MSSIFKYLIFLKNLLKLFIFMPISYVILIIKEQVMDGIANIARQQQSQITPQESQGRAVEQNVQVQPKQENIVKEMQQEASSKNTKLNSKKDVQDLVSKLNDALAPMSTNLKFGVDSQDIFYVSVIEAQTNKMIRRFPAEQAQEFLPKMQEVSGILFDTKG